LTKKPSGTVTFLFSDIEGSTLKWEKNAELMQSAFSRHESIMRNAMHNHGGFIYKMIGDAFQIAFSTAREAIEAALMAQLSLQSEEWGEIGPIEVRMALHTGVVEERGEDYIGPILNRVARMMSAGHGGQVLLSQATYELLRDDLPDDVSIQNLGEHRLKDLSRFEQIYQVISPGLRQEFPHLTTLNTHPNNLPSQLTSFIGREREIEEIEQLLKKSRLLTLLGPGGAGKTRLAIQVAANVLHHFEQGIFFVDLAPISDPQFVSRTIAETLNIRETASQPVVQSIKNYLGEKNLLFILDNFEQIVETAPLVADLLSSAPKLKVILTSRQPLMISGEQEYLVPPMGVPVLDHRESIKAISQYEAVELFINRAESVRPDFEITSGNASAIAEVCARLDGLPLAIELAAARIRSLSPSQLLDRLQTRFAELSGGMRDLPPRQQTLLATIDWSYDLLEEGEKELFARLSVFQGGRTLEAAEAVCGPDSSINIFDGLDSLTRQSLLYMDQGLDNEPRFMMLETIHEYARQKLIESDQVEQIKGQHADYYLALVERAEPEMRGKKQAYWSAKLRSEHDNLRTALSWSFSEGDFVVGIRLAGGLRDYWYYQGLFGEGWKWTETALEGVDQAPIAVQAKLYNTASHLLFYLGDHQRGEEWALKALSLYRDLGDERNLAWAYILLGSHQMEHPDRTNEGILLSEKGLALFRKNNDRPGIDQALTVIGELARMQGDYDRAGKVYQEALVINCELGDKYRESINLLNLAYVSHHRKDYQQEEELIKQALMLSGEFKTKYFTILYLDALASPIGATGEPERAATILGASQAFLDDMGIERQTADQHEIDRVLASLHKQLDESSFEAAWTQGRAMSLEQAIAFALGE
jgi:predicted ATPase/class 3 adenylate cyclase